MMTTKTSHPGRILREELKARGMTPHAFAMAIGVPASRIDQIVKLRRGVSPETALRLARYLGGSPKLWLRMQADWDLARAEKSHGREIRRSVKPPKNTDRSAHA